MKRMDKELGQTAIEGKVGAAFGSYGWSGKAPVDIAIANAVKKTVKPVA